MKAAGAISIFSQGAGTLSYGHNPPGLKERLIGYLTEDGIGHSLDMATTAKVRFIKRFKRCHPHAARLALPDDVPRFDRAPTPWNARSRWRGAPPGGPVSSASPTPRMGRASARWPCRAAISSAVAPGLPLGGVDRMPYDGYLGAGIDTLDYFERVLDDAGSGVDIPAAVVVETVQAGGGAHDGRRSPGCARLQALCRARGILLIADEIRTGCGPHRRFLLLRVGRTRSRRRLPVPRL